MRTNRDAAMTYVFVDEGGYAERPMEPGGAVNMGVSFERFIAWRALNKKPKPTWADLKAMPRDEARALYDKFFFNPAHFDDLPVGVDYVVLDGFINGGGLTILQRALGLAPTHHEVAAHQFGPVTLWGSTHRDGKALIGKLCDTRLARNRTLRDYAVPVKLNSKTTFGMIWDRRTELVRGRALKMAA
jgi:lysozyme family protein